MSQPVKPNPRLSPNGTHTQALTNQRVLLTRYGDTDALQLTDATVILPQRGEVLRRVDHTAIFLLIAGTLTLFHALAVRGSWRWGMVGVAWVLALLAMGVKLLFFDSLNGMLGLSLYVGVRAIGGISVLVLPRATPRVALLPMVCGAAAYVIGALVDVHEFVTLVEGLVGPHEVFHAAVLVGAGFHWSCLIGDSWSSIERFEPGSGSNPRWPVQLRARAQSRARRAGHSDESHLP